MEGASKRHLAVGAEEITGNRYRRLGAAELMTSPLSMRNLVNRPLQVVVTTTSKPAVP